MFFIVIDIITLRRLHLIVAGKIDMGRANIILQPYAHDDGTRNTRCQILTVEIGKQPVYFVPTTLLMATQILFEHTTRPGCDLKIILKIRQERDVRCCRTDASIQCTGCQRKSSALTSAFGKNLLRVHLRT
ncbi:unknown [Bacteroides sp. CAG:189]|nr:unknown [Bacteroides sp. CAG:189]